MKGGSSINASTTTYAPTLGRLVKEYKLSPSRVRQLIVLMLISAALAAMFLLPAMLDPSVPGLAGRACVSFVGLLFLVPVFLGVRQMFRLRGASLSLYENGLTYRTRGKESTTTWDEIDSYVQDSACRITKTNGEVIEFGLIIEGADEVADKIQEETLQRILPQTKAAILRGSSVQFKGLKLPGKPLSNFAYATSGFTVDKDGITEIDRGGRIAWKDVTDYGITEAKMGRRPVDVFFIQDANTIFRTRLGLLSNAHVLLALCAEMTGLK